MLLQHADTETTKGKKIASTKAVTIYLQATNDEQFPHTRHCLYGLMKVHAHPGIHRHIRYAVISYSFCTAQAATFRKWRRRKKRHIKSGSCQEMVKRMAQQNPKLPLRVMVVPLSSHPPPKNKKVCVARQLVEPKCLVLTGPKVVPLSKENWREKRLVT